MPFNVKACVLGASWLAGALWAGSFQTVDLAKLKKLQKEKCVFVHLWADWCAPCVQEMPELLPKLETWKQAKVVVLDTSSPFAQAHFSKKWNVLKRSPLPAYLKSGKIPEKTFRLTIDPEWTGTMPYSVLYSRGKRLKTWRGTLDFDAATREVAALCR